MADKLTDLGEHLELWKVHIDETREQDKNARTMPPEMFDRLVENIKKEGRLESVPFGTKDGDTFHIISGHHRIRAARQAGMDHIPFLVDTRDLDISQQRAKQIAHNAIDGQDDPEILQDMYDEIDRIPDMVEAYVDPEELDIPNPVDDIPSSGISVEYDWKVLNLTFLPHQLNGLEELNEEIDDEVEMVGAVSKDIYEEFADTIKSLGEAENIRSIGATIGRMVEIAQDYIEGEPNEPGS